MFTVPPAGVLHFIVYFRKISPNKAVCIASHPYAYAASQGLASALRLAAESLTEDRERKGIRSDAAIHNIFLSGVEGENPSAPAFSPVSALPAGPFCAIFPRRFFQHRHFDFPARDRIVPRASF